MNTYHQLWLCPEHPDQEVHLHCQVCGTPIFPRGNGDYLTCILHATVEEIREGNARHWDKPRRKV